MTTYYKCPVCPNGVIEVPNEANDEDEVACDYCEHYMKAVDARLEAVYEEE